MNDAERHKVLVEWNQTERDYPRDKCVHEVFEEQAERTPEAVAVVCGESSLTYRKLNERANRMACQINTLAAGSKLIGIRLERSLELPVVLLGILKTGAAYWALEENLSDKRLQLMLAEAKPGVLLTRRENLENLTCLVKKSAGDSPGYSGRVAAIEDLIECPADGKTFCAVPVQPVDPVYVSYTSGSTGSPKGVVVPHRGVVRLVKNADYVSLLPDDTLLHLSPLSFDASTFELWGALLNGGRVVMLPPGPIALADIAEAIRRHAVTTLWLTSGLFHLMVDECIEGLRPLRQLLSGGDVLSPEHVLKAKRALPGCRMINGYGPTENTTFTCCYTVTDESELSPSVPIGRPISNTRVYVLDDALQPVPVGEEGDLYAGGDGVACGYLHQPDLTAERFIPDPFSDRPGDCLYRTGDLARWRPDGNLEFLGRKDSQVKVRGFRIELGEVEAALNAQPEVRSAAVVLRENFPGNKQLVAYLVAKSSEKPDTSAFRAKFAKILPDYMVPAVFVWLDKMPLTPNGKVDRKALPSLEIPGDDTHGKVSQPINLLELELIRIWQRILQLNNISRQDNFFMLGGHSLLAARLASEIDKAFGCNIPIATLFQSPTVESLAKRLADENWAPPWSCLVPLQPQGSRPPIYFIHGVGGDVYFFLSLTRLLPPDQPSYGIQAVGLDGKALRHISVEEMAAHYVEEVISFQPEGPIYLAGFSLGGIIAFEMARQLHCRGRKVAFLGLLDSGPSGPVPWLFYGLSMSSYIPRRCLFHLRHWLQLSHHAKLDYFRGRLIALRHWVFINRKKSAPVIQSPPPGINPPEIAGFMDYYHAIGSTYRLSPYPDSADVFLSDEICPQWKWYWRYLVRGGVTYHRVTGRHNDLIHNPDHIPVLAKALTDALDHTRVAAHPSKENCCS